MSQNIQAIYALTPAQEGILFHAIEKPHDDNYFLQYACTIDGELNISAWQQSWARLSEEHDMLRTLFTWKGRPHPLQVVRNHVDLDWIVLDWRDKSAYEQAQKWQGFLEADRDLGFVLDKAPVMRFALIRINDSESRFLLSFHHVAFDGWSQRLLMTQAMQYYQEINTGAVNNHSRQLQSRFADFAKRFDSLDTNQAEQFWRDYLQGFTQASLIKNKTALSRAYEEETTHAQASKGSLHQLLDKDVSEALYAKARGSELTVNTMILGAWSLVLAYYCRQDDLVFGTTVSGRPVDLADADKIVGLFINTLPVRAKLAKDEESLELWLKHLQRSQIAARSYEQTPLSLIQSCSELQSADSLFDSIVVVENFATSDEKLDVNQNDDSSITMRDPVYTEYSHYPLAILVQPGNQLHITAVFQETGISQNQAQHLLDCLAAVLKQMSANLDLTLSQVKTEQHTFFAHAGLTKNAVEKNALQEIDQDNNLQTSSQPNELQACFQGIETLANESADALALIDLNENKLNDKQLGHKNQDHQYQTETQATTHFSYQALNEQANQLAHLLISKGVSRGDIVPILLERSYQSIISVLAVSKCGAAYAIFDPELAPSRLKSMIATLEQQKTWVISTSSFAEKLSSSDVDTLMLDEQTLSMWSTDNPNISVDSEDLAYVIYTSGTTGTAKGVKVSHRALSHSTFARAAYYESSPKVFLHISSLSTDSAIAGLYWTLCSKGTLLLAAKHAEQDCRQLGEDIRKYDVSHTLCIPSLYKLILENASTQDLSALHSVILAGESCPQALVQEHQNVLPTTRLFNEYGPSEYCVWATAEELTSYSSNQAISIGKVISNTYAYVLDEAKNPVEKGEVGELYLSGNNIADGYLNDPAKSAEVFLSNPFYSYDEDGLATKTEASRHLQMMYKTGDKVKQLDDERYVFVGRADHQLKIRGFRIEPEEIEKVLTEHEAVTEALVYAQSEPYSDEELVQALTQMDEHEAKRLLLAIEKQQ